MRILCFFGNVTDLGNVMSRFSRESILSLLSYGSHWSLALEDVECNDKTANVFLKVQRGAPGVAEHPKQAPKKEDRDDQEGGNEKGRGRSPAARSKPEARRTRPEFQANSGNESKDKSTDCPPSDCSGTPVDCDSGTCQVGHIFGPVPFGPFDDPVVQGVRAVTPECSHVVAPSSGSTVCLDVQYPSRQAVHSDSGCQTLGHSEPVPKPWLRCASGAAIGEDTASFSAKGFPAETFACYKKVRDGEALRWKSCLEFSIKPEDVVHDYASCGGLDHSPRSGRRQHQVRWPL